MEKVLFNEGEAYFDKTIKMEDDSCFYFYGEKSARVSDPITESVIEPVGAVAKKRKMDVFRKILCILNTLLLLFCGCVAGIVGYLLFTDGLTAEVLAGGHETFTLLWVLDLGLITIGIQPITVFLVASLVGFLLSVIILFGKSFGCKFWGMVFFILFVVIGVVAAAVSFLPFFLG